MHFFISLCQIWIVFGSILFEPSTLKQSLIKILFEIHFWINIFNFIFIHCSHLRRFLLKSQLLNFFLIQYHRFHLRSRLNWQRKIVEFNFTCNNAFSWTQNSHRSRSLRINRLILIFNDLRKILRVLLFDFCA